jgi:hypothetical protein
MGGGSGGGGFGLGPNEVKNLEERVKATLQASAPSEKQNVFISFVEEDLNDVNLLRGQAKNEDSNLEFNDWSLREPFDSENAEYIKRGIRERIRQSSVTLVYVSEHTANSKWVDWEIRETLALGKGVIAVHKGDSPPSRLPEACYEFRIKLVPWKQKEIARAIKSAVIQPKKSS